MNCICFKLRNYLLPFVVLILYSSFLSAQNGPGGIGNADGSDGQPELLFWINADSLNLSDNDPVSTWYDISGNGNDFSQSNAGQRPVFINSGISSQPAVEFDGSDQSLVDEDGENLVNGLNAFTFFAIIQSDQTGTDAGFFDGEDPNNNDNVFTIRYDSDGADGPGVNNIKAGISTTDNGEVNMESSSNIQTTTPQMLALQWASGEELNLYENSSLDVPTNGSGLATGAIINSDKLIVGKSSKDAGASWVGRIAEIFLYSSKLNAARRIIVENYLSDKYNIDITPNDYFTGNGSFSHSIAGIGQVSGDNNTEANSEGFILSQNGGLDDGDFVLFAHDNKRKDSVNQGTEVTNCGAEAAWYRDWYVEKTDAGTGLGAKLSFDIREGFENGKYPQEVGNYRLLYRANTGDDYDTIAVNSRGIESADQVYFTISSANFSTGYYTLGTVNQTESPVEGDDGRTWYTLISGDWENWETWTLDPSGALPDNPDNEIPSKPTENVVILSGNTVTVNSDDIENATLTVNGRLDLQETSGHTFGEIRGGGKILIADDNFPSGDATHFVTPGQGEGAVEFYGDKDSLTIAREFYDFTVDLNNSADTLTLLADLTVNNNFRVETGDFKINGNTTTSLLNIDVGGDVNVTSNASMSVGEADIYDATAASGYGNYHKGFHVFEVGGDFTNEGTVRFTNQSVPDYSNITSTGAVSLKFTSASDNEFNIYNTTDLYNLVIDKGNDRTYKLTLYSDDVSYFALYGQNDDNWNNGSTPEDNANPENRKALWINDGTLELTGNLFIPSLSEGGVRDFTIGNDASLLLNGANVQVNVTADGATDFTNLSHGDPLNIDNGNSWQGIYLMGKLQLDNGTFIQRSGEAINFRDEAPGILEVNGGSLTANQIAISSAASAGTYSYLQRGGTVEITGDDGPDGNRALLHLNNQNMSFNMSGGEIRISGTSAHDTNAVNIGSDPINLNVTGGLLRFELTGGTNAQLYSTSNIWDVEIVKTAGGGDVFIELDTSLKVSNDLTIGDGTTNISNVVLDHDGYDVSIGGDFTIETDGAYYFGDPDSKEPSNGVTWPDYTTPGSHENTTIFNGTGNSNIVLKNLDPDDTDAFDSWTLAQPFHNITIDKPNGDTVTFNAPNRYPTNNAMITSTSGIFTVESGVFNNNDYSIMIAGDVINKGQLGVYEDGEDEVWALIKFPQNDMTISTEEGAIFGNMRLSNDNHIMKFTSDVTVQRLQYTHGRIDIGKYNLKLENFDIQLNGVADANGNCNGCFSIEDMIATDGNISDGGLTIKIPLDGNNSPGSLNSYASDYGNIYNFPDASEFPDATFNEDYFLFPLGIRESTSGEGSVGEDYFTPLLMNIGDVSAATDGDEYITVNPVKGELKTTNLSGGAYDSLTWRIRTEGFSGDLQIIEIKAYGYNDLMSNYANSGIVNAPDASTTNSVSGGVLDGGDYERFGDEESAIDPALDGLATENAYGPHFEIVFNGADDNVESDGTTSSNDLSEWGDASSTTVGVGPINLTDVNLTFAEENRFDGSPDIYYSRNAFFGSPGNCENGCDIDAQDGNPYCGCAGVTWDFFDNDWNGSYNSGNGGSGGADAYVAWSTTGHDGDPTSDLPGPGDIVEINQCARVVFYDETVTFAKVINNGTMSFETNSNTDAFSSDLGEVDGEGTIFFDYNNGGTSPASLPDGDFGNLNNGFVSNSGSKFLFRIRDDANYQIPSNIEVYPNVDFYSSSANSGAFQNGSNPFGDLRKFTLPNEDITINGNLIIQAGARVLLNTTSDGDITVKGNMTLGTTPNPVGRIGALYFQNSGTARTFAVESDILIRNGDHQDGDNDGTNDHSIIEVLDGGSAGLIHTLVTYGDIILEDKGKLDLVGDDAKATLEIRGASNNIFSQDGSSTNPELYRVLINKGTDTTYSFSFNDNFNLTGPTDGLGVDKALELQNGKLILNNPNINIALTTGDDDFYVPSTTALEIKQGQATASGGSGILLDGKLQITGGTLDMSGGDNYIEYSASGNAELEINSGNLTVGSQIRRQTSTEAGILKYSQAGGEVVVGENSAPVNNRGVMEIVNAGSDFTLSGGELYIANAQSNPSIASFLLEPETSNITSNGKIFLGHSTTNASQIIGINSTVNLPKLFTDNSSSNSPEIKMWVRPLTVTDTLNIVTGTTLNTDGLDLNIKGDFIVQGTFDANNNTTYFNGTSNQEITGSPVFWNLFKTTSNNLLLNNDIDVDNELNLDAGTFNDGGNTLSVQGNVNMLIPHTWGGTGNGILMNGSSQQELTGNSTFGKLSIHNSQGVYIPEGNEFTISQELQLIEGVLDIGKNLLIIEENAQIIEANAFSENNMIQTNISFTDAGIKKEFPAIAPADNYTFTYPIGSKGKYTPVIFSIDEADAGGSIRIKAADERHPTITEDTEPCNEIVDQDNVLQYHWVLEANNITGFTGDARMQYYEEDYEENSAFYDVTDYIAARLLFGSTLWNKFDESSFDESNQQLIFSYSNTDDNGISGDYTAGIEDQDGTCEGAIPDEVPSYITINNGNWADENIWDTYPTSGGTVPAGGPSGAIAIVEHEVDITQNYIVSYRTTINSAGLLKTGTTFGHRLGIVDGKGTLQLERGTLPAGVYDEFFSPQGGTLEYTGTDSYDVLGQIVQVNNLKFSGTGERRLPNTDLEIFGQLTIDGTDATLEVINEQNRNITLDSNLVFNQGTFDAGTGSNAEVILNGNSLQTITGCFEGSNAFNYLTLQNSSGLEIMDSIEVDETFTLNNGMVYVPDTGLVTLNSTATGALSGAADSRYIQGPLRKKINNGDTYTFEVGDTSRYGRLELSNTSPTTAEFWEVQYYNNETHPTYDTSSYESSLERISNNEYWRVKGPGATSDAFVKIRWDDQSVLPAQTSNRSANLRIAEWNTGASEWQSVGSDVTDNGATSGTVRTNSSVALEEHIFTLASTEPNPQATAAFSTEDTAVCVNETIQLTATLSGQGDIVFTINKDGIPYDTITASSEGDTTFIINSSAVLGDAGVYSIDSVGDDNGTGYVYGESVTVTVNSLPDVFNVIDGGTVCDDDSVEIRLDGSVAGINYELYRNSTYTGIVVGGTGDTISFGYFDDPSDNGNYEVLAINSSTGCEQYMNGVVNVTINTVPNPEPYINETNPICYNEENITLYANDVTGVGNDYSWTPAGDLDNAGAENPDYLTSNPPVRSDTTMFNVTVTNTGTGCQATDSVQVILLHRPETGNQYYVPDDFDQ
jgi:hypothetical protein